jgi:tetratricopeptide (TPR) repeat protein
MPRFAAAALLAAVLSAANAAAAQSAKELYERGVAALNESRFADAMQALDASYRKEQVPSTLYNLGLAYKGLGHPDKALQAFEGYVKFADPKKDAKTIEAVRGEIERLKNSYARFALKLTPADAVIEIDGTRTVPSNNELWVRTGKRKISVRASGFETYEQELDVAAGRFDLEVRLREPSLPPEQRAAALVDEGMALQAAGSLAQALDKYTQAHQIHPTPRGTAQMGLTAETLGDLGAAEQHITQALKTPKDPYIREHKRRLQAALTRLKRQIATVDVKGTPAGAEVFVNERSQGTLPLAVPVRTAGGTVTVRAKKEGYRDFEQVLEIPARGRRAVVVSMEEAPAPLVAAAPLPAPAPAPPPSEAVPALAIEAEEPKPSELPPPESQPEPERPAQQSTQADIESFADGRTALEGEPTEPREPATGFEMALNFGYQPWVGGPKPAGSSGMLSPQLLLGARLLWPLSFGVQLNGGFDLGADGTQFVGAANPGLYVRGHIQRWRKRLSFDAWAGAGIQPFAVQAAVLEPQELDITMVDVNQLDDRARDALARQMAGVDIVRTIQSLNVPLELGVTFYITKGFGVNLATALTFWLPQQDCLHDGTDRLCRDDGLSSQTSFYVGAGLAFLP